MKTLVTGSSGLVGSALVEFLFKKDHSIQCLQRNTGNESDLFWGTQSPGLDNECKYKAVIHLAGENVANGRWTSTKKKRILNSRFEGTKQLVDYISQLTTMPEVFLCASAVGYYGSRGAEMLDEGSSLGTGFLAEVCDKWEKETHRLTAVGIRVVNLRFGMVLSPKGGALHKMVPPFKACLGGVVGSGDQYISWISIKDLVEAVEFIIQNEHIAGPVNIVSPLQTTNRLLTQSLGRVLNRPTFFRVPSIIAKVLFGEMADEMLLSSTRATPKMLLESGYEYKDKSLDEVLRFCTETG
jgi:uncharacterized protein (TIGR01777 family)